MIYDNPVNCLNNGRKLCCRILKQHEAMCLNSMQSIKKLLNPGSYQENLGMAQSLKTKNTDAKLN